MLAENIKFKDVVLEDKSDLSKIYQEFIDVTHATQPEDMGASFELFMNNKNGYLTFIYSDNLLAGFVEYRDLPFKLRDSNQKVEITSLFVRPQYQKQGLGKKLIKYVADFAAATNKDRVVLYSGLELTEAHKFYEKVGFEKKALFFELKVNK